MAIVDATHDALETLKRRFEASGIQDEFRPRACPPERSDGWWRLVCVDQREQIISGVRSVEFRPTITGRVPLPPKVGPQDRGKARARA